MITPEQFSYSAEKKLLETLQSQSVINAEILSFNRMAYRIFLEVGGYTNVNLSKTGKAMLLYNIINKQGEILKFLNKSTENIEIALNTIAELKKHNVLPNDIQKAKELTKDFYLKTKLSDIDVLYSEYTKTISDKFIDEEDTLTLLSNKIEESTMFDDSYIYIDEFIGFTTQEYEIIKKLLLKAKEVTITVCTDNIKLDNLEIDVFGPSKKVATKLLNCGKDVNVEITKPIEVNYKNGYKNNELKYIEENFYNISSKIEPYQGQVNNINLSLTQNPYSEIENVAKNITKLVREKQYKYKDIVIISKNIEEYEGIAKAIFNTYGIPVFIDKNEELSKNVLIKYILSILEIFEKSWSHEVMFNYIKSGFLNIEKKDLYNLEKYCIKWGIRGKKWYEEDWKYENENTDKMNYLRTEITRPLLELKERLNVKNSKEITKEIYEFLLDNNIKEKLEKKVEKLEKTNNFEIAKEYKASWDTLIDVLDEMTLVLGEDKITFEKYKETLKIGLKYSDLGKIPTTIDQVLFADVDRSKPKNAKVVFILGVNDGIYPSTNKKEGFLNDKDRKILKEMNLEIANGTLENLYEEQFNIYKILTLAEEKLYLSYVSADKEGKNLRPSILISKIKKIFPKLKEESSVLHTESEITTIDATFKDLLMNLRKAKDGKKIDDIWEDVYLWYSRNDKWNQKLKISLKGIEYDNNPEIINNYNIKALYGEKIKASISKLEQYRKCPFSFHLKYGIKLQEEKNFEIKPIDIGSFMHEVIDEFFEKVENIRKIENNEIKKVVEQIIDEKLYLRKNYIFMSNSKFIVLTNRLKKVILQAIEYIVEQMKKSSFEILGNEVEFHQEYDNVELTGKIDRIDVASNQNGEYIRIIDYKSRTKKIDLNEMISGIQIQLLTYIDVMADKYNKIPSGVLYYNLIDPIIPANKNLTEEEIAEKLKKEFRMNGLVLADIKIIKMMDNELTTGTSTIIPVSIKKEGDISESKSDVVTREEFTKLRKSVRNIINQISKEILSGKIDLNPIYNKKTKKTTCECCEYKAICGFNPSINSYNFIGNKSKEEILWEE